MGGLEQKRNKMLGRESYNSNPSGVILIRIVMRVAGLRLVRLDLEKDGNCRLLKR